MTENLKKFVEYVSSLDNVTMEKVTKMEKEEITAFAAEKGFTLTEADFEMEEKDEALSIDELDAAAGGGECFCPAAGGGKEELIRNEDGTESGDGGCACVLGGAGRGFDHDQDTGLSSSVHSRCVCALVGIGKSLVS